MMTVERLMEALKKFDKTAIVHINGVAVSGIEAQTGRYNTTDYEGRDANGNVRFRRAPKGKQVGVTFTHNAEMSDGIIRPSDCWQP